MFNSDIRKLKKDKKNYDAIFNMVGSKMANKMDDDDKNKDILENLSYDSYLKLPSELKEKVNLNIDKYLKNAHRTPSYLKFNKKLKELTNKKIDNVDDFLKLGIKFNKDDENDKKEEKRGFFLHKKNKNSEIKKTDSTSKSVAKIAGTTLKGTLRTGLGVFGGCVLLGMFQFFGSPSVLPIITTFGIGSYLVVKGYKDIKNIVNCVKNIVINRKVKNKNKKSKNKHVNTKNNDFTYPILDMQDEKVDDNKYNFKKEKYSDEIDKPEVEENKIGKEREIEYPILDMQDENVDDNKYNFKKERYSDEIDKPEVEKNKIEKEREIEYPTLNMQDEKSNNSNESLENKNLMSNDELDDNKQEDKDIVDEEIFAADDTNTVYNSNINISNLSDTDLKVAEIKETVNKIKILNNYKKDLENQYDFVQRDILKSQELCGLNSNKLMKVNQNFADRINQRKELTKKIKKCENAILMHNNMIQKELDYKKLCNESRSIQNLEQMKEILISLSEMNKKSERFINEITVSDDKFKSR